MTQSDKILHQLESHMENPGITTKAIAHGARVPVDAVSKRIADLRATGHRIYTNYRKVRGSNAKKAYYRLYA
jgi:hypothetical protein